MKNIALINNSRTSRSTNILNTFLSSSENSCQDAHFIFFLKNVNNFEIMHNMLKSVLGCLFQLNNIILFQISCFKPHELRIMQRCYPTVSDTSHVTHLHYSFSTNEHIISPFWKLTLI